MNRYLSIFLILFCTVVRAQTLLQGSVQDARNEVVVGANVYLKDTYDGTSSDVSGDFTFTTEETGTLSLIVSAIGYQTYEVPVTLSGDSLTVKVTLKEVINKMNGVTIMGGAFAASDEQKGIRLKPLDIVTTAGALGDITGALTALPGAQTVGEDGRLIVRGGSGDETKTFMDGMLVHSPYGASAPDVPTRGRFSPFIFKGTTFSTGGYSAEYGQALSSVLLLNTVDLPAQTQTDFSLMSVGADATHQHRWNKTSVSAKAEYTNLTPYQGLVKQEMDWQQAPTAGGGSVALRRRTSATGMLKLYGYANRSQMALNQPDINRPQPEKVRLQNDNVYLNATYQEVLNQRWTLQTGAAYTYDVQATKVNKTAIDARRKGLHTKVTFVYDATERVALRLGAEHLYQQEKQDYQENSQAPMVRQQWQDNLSATFIEADIYASSRFMARAGGRLEYSSLTGQATVAPRLSMAYKTSKAGQVSLAYGSFYQRPESQLLLDHSPLASEQAQHYIASYQVVKNERTFRVEAFDKEYRHLVKFAGAGTNHQGYGYARGLEVFWRDRSSIKNSDYWVSYSFLDSKRDYRDFPTLAVPTFAARHSFSFVYKYFVPSIRTQFGARYSLASGRTYFNPNHEQFRRDLTKSYHNLSLNVAYLIKQHIILYASAINVLGRDNIFGYQYADQPNAAGNYERQAIRPSAPRFLFVGLFITLTRDKQANQLQNL